MTTDNYKKAVHARVTGEVPLILLTITHDELTTPIRVVDNTEDIISRGDVFLKAHFKAVFPSEEDGSPPMTKITIPNINREILRILKSVLTPAEVLMEVVLASSPDIVEMFFANFVLKDVDYEALSITGTVIIDTMMEEPYPADSYVPSTHPGMF